jgi:hypothetical protein
MKQFLTHGIIGNAAAMGLNWVYNMPYLERLAKEQSLLFQPVDPEKYKRAGKAYFAYPHAKVGDISVQGEIARWLDAAIVQSPELSREQYQELLFEQFKPGGDYVGYVESYGKQLVINKLSEQVKAPLPNLQYNDDQMVGLVPYWVCKSNGLSTERAWDLAQAFTSILEFKDVYEMMDELLVLIPKVGMRQAIKQAASLAPISMKIAIQKAMDLTNTLEFITNHSGTACHIPHAIPLILHILYHTTSFTEALEKNTVIGGASCDRGFSIGALAGLAYDVPSEFLSMISS